MKNLGEDIRYIKTRTSLSEDQGFFVGKPAYWILAGLLLLAAAAVWLSLRKLAARRADVAGNRNRKATRQALKRLRLAGDFLNKNLYTAFYEELHRALIGFITDKLSMDMADQSKENIAGALSARGVPEETVKSFTDLLDACEFARYAPDAGHEAMNAHYEQAVSVITAIDSSMKKGVSAAAAAPVIALLLVLPLGARAAENYPDSLWQAGVEAYAAGQFEDALQDWSDVEATGLRSRELYYNLGNAYFKTGQTARAILNYERALRLDPSDADIRYNLEFARAQTQDRIDEVPEFILKTWTRKMGYWMSSDAWAVLSLVLLAVALGLVLLFWDSLTQRFGVPRTIITLFFIYLCLLAELYNISVRMMLGNVLERMTMYGVLVLAMMPGIQCGIGLNMGMTIGCISGLLGIVLSLQFDMVGFPALLFACFTGTVISLPLGWAYSKLLNRMKGNEMTISTYVGFSFVSLMCIGWMMLPFNNPKIIWLLSGRGLRVTHSLLGSFAHLLDNFLSFRLFGINVPTGGLLFLGICCFIMWLFSRSRTGIAMTAAGSNPRFAEASGINVNRMRTVGTVLSTMIAAVGIVIYSQAFGYAQLYTAPRQLGFIAASAILIGGATVSKARVSHVLIGVFLFEGVLVFGQQIANSVVAGGGLSEVMRIMISNGIILYALTQSGGARRD